MDNEKKPSKARKVTNDLLAYLHGQVFKKPVVEPFKDDTGPAVFCGELTIKADLCCLEALCFSIRAAICAEVLNPRQQRCLGSLLLQIESQIPRNKRKLLSDAARHASEELRDWRRKKLFKAAVDSPSVN